MKLDKKQIEICAEAAHEMNRIYCESQSDFTQVRWCDAPEWQRASSINGVAGVLAGATPEQSHESWLAEKIAAGWKYGAVKDVEVKTHPCCVPYAELPPEQQRKDQLYIATVKAIAEALGG
jgi:hypothetical protein